MVLTQQRIKRRDEIVEIYNKTKSEEKKKICLELIESLNKLISQKKKKKFIFF